MKYLEYFTLCSSGGDSAMSRSEAGLIIFASLLMAAIVISYVCQDHAIGASELFSRKTTKKTGTARIHTVTTIEDDDYDSWRPSVLPQKLSKAEQDDNQLIEYIRKSWILPPPSSKSMRTLHSPETYDHSEYGQSFVVDKLLHGKEGGFFVDVWAGNGETNSNTLFLEKDRFWTGLLIEPNPKNFRTLVGKRRHVYMLNACVSPTTKPNVLNLTLGDEFESQSVLVQCFPLYSIMQALGIRHIDYLSLRSELELDILKTLPLKVAKLSVDAITVKTDISKNRRDTLATNEKVKEMMIPLGYHWVDSGEKINKKTVILHKDKT